MLKLAFSSGHCCASVQTRRSPSVAVNYFISSMSPNWNSDNVNCLQLLYRPLAEELQTICW